MLPAAAKHLAEMKDKGAGADVLKDDKNLRSLGQQTSTRRCRYRHAHPIARIAPNLFGTHYRLGRSRESATQQNECCGCRRKYYVHSHHAS
jgi:hypothetical protein